MERRRSSSSSSEFSSNGFSSVESCLEPVAAISNDREGDEQREDDADDADDDDDDDDADADDDDDNDSIPTTSMYDNIQHAYSVVMQIVA
ncbi:hypothetical protein T4E_10507 [Trichinella pseudospiralis]|uniref:Uncharacterized protein n=1 Tax=Trichinella pseudospiralis TaxID=6337 RepID=A0A0V0YIH2_TRIPS|nr:hypothetical protein T4E_10507 [Trichinella pseudospiralis]